MTLTFDHLLIFLSGFGSACGLCAGLLVLIETRWLAFRDHRLLFTGLAFGFAGFGLAWVYFTGFSWSGAVEFLSMMGD